MGGGACGGGVLVLLLLRGVAAHCCTCAMGKSGQSGRVRGRLGQHSGSALWRKE